MSEEVVATPQVSLSAIPGIKANNIADLVPAIIEAGMKGIPVLVTAKVLEHIRDVLESVGIRIEEVGDKIPYDTYILIKSGGGIKIIIEVVENGELVNRVTTTVSALVSAIKALFFPAEKKKRGMYYRIIIPPEVKNKLGVGDDEL